MQKISKSVATVTILALAGLAVACGPATVKRADPATGAAQTPAATMSLTKAETTTSVQIPGDYFSPLLAVVHAGDTVTWSNTDKQAHTLVSVPGSPASFRIAVAAGASASYTFSEPGVYRYYGARFATYKASADIQGSAAPMQRVLAEAGADLAPAPMRGVIVVMNARGGMPASGGTTIDIPDSTMDFTPFALVVPAGSTVTWTNHDDMTHVVAPVPGYAAATFKTLAIPGKGGRASLTFSQPGVYYYYCPLHAGWDASHQQLVPLRSYGSYPFVMDGLLIVTPGA